MRERMHAYLAGTCRNMDSPSIIVDGPADHIHVLSSLSRKHTVADFIRELKRESSKWIKTEEGKLEDFRWQSGYGAFSISPSHAESLRNYIASQVEHHKTETFQEEFRRFLRKNGIEYDERYVWD